MPKKIGSVTRQVLVNATLPAATQTYTVISHQFVIDTVMEQLQNNGFSVEKELYKCTAGAQVASGLFKLTYGNDPDLSLMYAFGNSYDKTMKFKSAIGAYVNQNDAVMISRFNDWTRKHTGSADEETVETIKTQVEAAKEYFDELKTQKDLMSQITVSRIEFASLVGQLYFLKFITADQISIVLKEYDNPTYTYTLPNDNLWTCYNHILVALKRTHPKNWIDNQIAVHLHICNSYKLFDYDEVEDTVEDTVAEDVEETLETSVETVESENHDSEIILPGFSPCQNHALENDKDEEEANARMDVIGQNGNTGEHYTDSAEVESITEATEDEVVSQLYGVDNDIEVSIPVDDKEENNTEEEVVEVTYSEEPAVANGEVPDLETSSLGQEEIPATVESNLNYDDELAIPQTSEPVKDNAETFYFMKEDYEGVEIGDYIEEEGVYYKIINDESIDESGDYWVCVKVDINVDETEEEEVTEPSPEIMAEVNVVEAEVSDEEELPAELETIVEDIETNSDVPYQDPALKEVIKSELSFLYDYDDMGFTYELVDGQYNITLGSGETCSFAQSYIEQQV